MLLGVDGDGSADTTEVPRRVGDGDGRGRAGAGREAGAGAGRRGGRAGAEGERRGSHHWLRCRLGSRAAPAVESPELKWTEIPTSLNLDDAKSRLEIREFILRFASIMEPSMPRTQLAELDDLGCDSDDNEMAPWVSDACVKSMILGLLGMLATLKGDIQKVLGSFNLLLRSKFILS